MIEFEKGLPLGQVFKFRQGIQRGVKLQSEVKTEGQVRFLRIVDYTQGNEPPRYIDFPGKQYIIKETDICLVRYGASTGFVCKGISGALANNLFRLIPNEDFKIESDYLFYFLLSPIFQDYIKRMMNGAAMPAISFGMIEKVLFPYTPLPEQKQIVTILDKAFAAIDQAKANIERNIENAKELFQSKLNEIFSQPARPSGGKGEGWEEKTLSEVCRYDKSKHNGEDLPYVGLEHIESNTGSYLGDLEPMKVKSSTFAFNSNHVLYGRLRPYLNKVLLPDFSGHCSTEIFPICTNEMLKRRFLFYWFLAPITVQKIDATWTGARMPRANMNEVINFKINIPSIEIQTKLTKELDSLMRYSTQIENKYKSKLITLEELKKSILQKAFAGELTEKEVAV